MKNKDMKNKFFQTKKEVAAWLKKLGVSYYAINDDLTVDVNGDVMLTNRGLTWIPVKFGIVGGFFDCRDNKLTSLEFAPKTAGGGFNCSGNSLTSLMYAPVVVGGGFYCNNNKITSLEFAPNVVGFSFNCADNKLTSLEFCPKQVGGGFDCSNNKITSLEYCPEVVLGDFFCMSNSPLGDFQNIKNFDVIYEEHLKLLKTKEVKKLEKDVGGIVLEKKKNKI